MNEPWEICQGELHACCETSLKEKCVIKTKYGWSESSTQLETKAEDAWHGVIWFHACSVGLVSL